ncbi:MAG: T9SS type A sorting domain-containing protein [Candidatus Kapabacteria bacterium]|nr:T9SS type A sorting domain-containing protein [Candidatus Kapabacteria bacterium]
MKPKYSYILFVIFLINLLLNQNTIGKNDDLEVFKILEPADSSKLFCNEMYHPKVELKNNGTTTRFNIRIVFYIYLCNPNGFFAVGETIDSIPPSFNNTFIYTFQSLFRLPYPEEYYFVYSIVDTLGSDSTNNKLKTKCIFIDSLKTSIKIDYESIPNIYPNPTNGVFNIDNVDAIEKIKIFDILGNTVYESDEPKSNLKINIINSGIYFIQTTSNNQLIYKKLVVI